MKTSPLLNTALAAGMLTTTACAQTSRVYFGTSNSKGIYFSDLDTKTGALTPPALAAETTGAGFIAIHPNKHMLYSTDIAAFRINSDGTLTLINKLTPKGRDCCHISIDQTGQCLMAACYGSGSVSAFRIREDGSLSDLSSYHQHAGSGDHPQRQTGPHAHSIIPNPANTHAYAPDLGIDKIMIYKLHPGTGTLTEPAFACIPGGSMGPRHMKWSTDGSFAYVLNELDLSISVFRPGKDAGSLVFIRTVSTLPEKADKSDMLSAEIRIHPNGQFIYASNRDLTKQGRDSISVFTRYEDGFQRLGTVPAEVWMPRNFNIDPTGQWMLVGGQWSNDIAIFKVDPATGLLRFTGTRIPFDGEPICIEFLD
ncbi:MAG TPA: lactonase family protein [Pontiella sp.]|nr:lactonase family protein [Pontiella sp.]